MPSSVRLITRARAMVHKIRSYGRNSELSADYRLATEESIPTADGWRSETAANEQHLAFQRLLKEARDGNPRLDFQVAALAISATRVKNPLIIEIGCGSGYYCEALPLLLKRPIRYIGIDFSGPMVALAHSTYEHVPFLAGDACKLPLRDGCCDIILNGTSLMHITNYRRAIAESVRASRQWCIFHTVPVIEQRSTTLLTKLAYGRRVAEVIFNRREIESMLHDQRLAIEQTFDSIPYDVSAVVGEASRTVTYLCRKI